MSILEEMAEIDALVEQGSKIRGATPKDAPAKGGFYADILKDFKKKKIFYI